jgi:hypothetical protein
MGAGGAHCCSDSLVAVVAEAIDADICTVQQIKVQYCHQNGEFFVSCETIFTAGSSKLNNSGFVVACTS